MTHADWLISGLEKVILPSQEIHLKFIFGFDRTDLAPRSLPNLRQYFPVQASHSVNKSLILFLL